MILDAPTFVSDIFFGPGPIVWTQQTIGPGWAPFFRVATIAGVSWGVIVAVGLGLWLWGRESAYSILGIVVLEALASTAMNQVFFLPRPDAPSIIRYEYLEIGSFPSGHVFTATAIWGWLYFRRWIPAWASGLIITVVAIGRIYLGVHFLGDVVGGFLLGCGLIWIHARVWPRVFGWLRQRDRGFFVALGGVTMLSAFAAVTLLEPDNPYAWDAVGVMLAAPVALTVERAIGSERGPNAPQPMLAFGIGLAGVLPFLGLWFRLPESATYMAAATAGAATLWAWSAAPALLTRLPPR